MVAALSTEALSPTGTEPVASYSERLFGHLPRGDQRRWAHAYLRALLATPGRKSIRNLAAAVSGSPTAGHSLQQFINASTWNWRASRHELTRWIEESTSVRAWALAPVVLPKRGEHAVGTHKRFVPHLGRTVNCQTGLALLLCSDGANFPVDWLLALPQEWTSDGRLRERARIPGHVRHKPLESHMFDLASALAGPAPRRRAPVVIDASRTTEAGILLRGLQRLGRDFVVSVPPELPVVASGTLTAAPGARRPRAIAARQHFDMNRTSLAPCAATPDPEGRLRPARILSGLVHLPPEEPGEATGPGRALRLFSLPRAHENQTSPIWISSLTHSRPGELLELAGLAGSGAATISCLNDRFGLLDFGGRSFPGWHRHMTMVSAAYAYQRLAEPAGAGPVTSAPAEPAALPLGGHMAL